MIDIETEADFMSWVIDCAHVHGWKVAHFRPARTLKGWRTPVTADTAGFPDLLLCHEGRKQVIAIECKSTKGKATPEQLRWLDLLEACGIVAFVARPSDRERIENILSKPSGCD